MNARDHIAAHFTSDALANELLDAYRVEILREEMRNLRRIEREDTPQGALGTRTGLLRAALILDERAELVREKATAPATTATPDLKVYRAEHPDSGITLGHYGTRQAARKHCETVLRREVGDEAFLCWVPDDGTDLATEELCTNEGTECTGYIVTTLELASEYDEEADE
ncbi:hypothetical protein [Streptomyces sp. NPDC004685]